MSVRPLLLGAGLLNAKGTPVPDAAAALSGKRVALYFAAGWCPMCTAFEPALGRFRAAEGDIELIMVSSDRSASEAAARAAQLDAMMVPFGAAADEFKRSLRVWSGSEVLKLGMGRRSGVPALVVLGPDGEEIGFVDAERRGEIALRKWPEGGRWS